MNTSANPIKSIVIIITLIKNKNLLIFLGLAKYCFQYLRFGNENSLHAENVSLSNGNNASSFLLTPIIFYQI